MVKNEEYTGTVSALGSDGEGIITTQDGTVFVPYCLTGEVVRYKVLSVKGRVAYGKVMQVIKASPDRVTPECPVFGKCGGCSLQHMSYSAQADYKRTVVANALYKIGGIFCEVLPTEKSPQSYCYRNKLALPVGRQNGKNAVGFYAMRSHRIVPITECAIQRGWSRTVISCLTEFMDKSGLCGYDEETKKGDIRRVVARDTGAGIIVAVVAAKTVDISAFADSLERELGSVSVLLNINGGTGNAIFGERFITVKGSGFFTSEDMGIKFRAGANTFLQVNDGVKQQLYKKVTEEAAGHGVAVDLYSGGGMLTALLAKECGLAYGVEAVKEASVCADELKTLNGLDGKMFNICGKVEDKLSEVFAATQNKRRVIVCDPPRKGMERSVVKGIIASGADKVILVSCNPATLARDMGLLCGTLTERDGALVKSALTPEYAANNGVYRIEYIQPYDMFPQTSAVETLAVLSLVVSS